MSIGQPDEHGSELLSQGTEHTAEGFNAGEVIIEHVANSPLDHPLIHLPHVLGVNLSVTKQVLMLWIVAFIVFVIVTATVRRYLKQDHLVPVGLMNGLEGIVLFVRDSIVLPNVGPKHVGAFTPLILTFFFFILVANGIGLIPVFEVIGLTDHLFLHAEEESLVKRVLHGGTTVTANFNVTAALASITFVSIIIAGSRAHGFLNHWKNLLPRGLPWPVYILLVPIEILGMFVKPFALTMRLAANMTAGHIAILAVLSFVFIFTELFQSAFAGIGVGLAVSVPLAVGISALEIIVILIQAYVFTLLSAVFIGMAINVHH